jgi:hypothetical protein
MSEEEGFVTDMGGNIAGVSDIPEECWPFLVEFYDRDTGVVYHSVEVTAPGVLEVPPATKFGVPLGRGEVRITFADGTGHDTMEDSVDGHQTAHSLQFVPEAELYPATFNILVDGNVVFTTTLEEPGYISVPNSVFEMDHTTLETEFITADGVTHRD